MTDYELPEKDQNEPFAEPSFGDATAEIPPIEVPSELASDRADAFTDEIPTGSADTDTDSDTDSDTNANAITDTADAADDEIPTGSADTDSDSHSDAVTDAVDTFENGIPALDTDADTDDETNADAVTDAADTFENGIPALNTDADGDTNDETNADAVDTFENGIPALDTDADGVTDTADSLGTDGVPIAGFSEDELLGAAAAASLGDTGDIEQPPPVTDEPAATPPPSSPPPPGYPPAGGYYGPPPVRRIYRSAHDRKVGGVSGGLAEYFRIDPTLARLAVLLFLFSGIGIIVYLLAWLIIPIRPAELVEPANVASIADERTMTIAFGVAALAIAFGVFTGSWAILSLALIGGGIWLLSEHTAVARVPAPMPAAPGMAYQAAPTYVEPPPQWPAQPVGSSAPNLGMPQPPAPQPLAPQASPKRPRRRQSITWTVLSLLALLAAVGIAAASGDWWNVSATRFLGIGVIIIGVGVVLGQIRNGGARGLIPLGILAALLLFPVSAVDGLLDDGIGETVHRPADFSELASTYEHGIGSMTVDLSRLDFAGRSESIDIDLGIGELIVIVSEETGGEALLEAQAGEISHERRNANGFVFQEGVNIETGIVQLEGSNGTLDLDISVGLGTVELLTRGN